MKIKKSEEKSVFLRCYLAIASLLIVYFLFEGLFLSLLSKSLPSRFLISVTSLLALVFLSLNVFALVKFSRERASGIIVLVPTLLLAVPFLSLLIWLLSMNSTSIPDVDIQLILLDKVVTAVALCLSVYILYLLKKGSS